MANIIQTFPTGAGGGDGQTIQVDTMPTASIDELGKIYQYVGADGNEADLLEDTANDFVGEGIANYRIDANAIALFAYRVGNGIVKYKNPISNNPNATNLLRITSSYVSGSGSTYAGFALGSTLGGTDIYQSPNFMNMGIGNTRVYDIDLSEYDAEEIYLSFLSNCNSGDWNFNVTDIEYTSISLYKNGYFYKCVSDGESTPTYSWIESPTFSALYEAGDGIDISDGTISTDNMPSTDMSEVASPMPSVMSRRMKYSTEEQIIGEWIDGKPLYQKTIRFTNLNIPQNSSNNLIDVSSLNIDELVNLQETGKEGDNWFRFDEYTTRTFLVNNILTFTTVTYWNFSVFTITLQYTKTTD